MEHNSNIEVINLSEIVLPEGLIKKIPQGLIEKYQFIPISLKDNILTVAFGKMPRLEAVNEIQRVTNYEMKVVLASKEDIQQSIMELLRIKSSLSSTSSPTQAQPVSLVSEVTDKSKAVWIMDMPGKVALAGCFITLFVLTLSAFMQWIKIFAGGICGISGDGKIVVFVSVATAVFLGVTLAVKKYLRTSVLVCSGWGIIASFWMAGFIYRISNTTSSTELKDNPFAALFAAQITPGTGLYLGLVASLGLVIAAVYQSLRMGTGKTFIQKNKLLLGTQASAVVLGILLTSFYVRIPQAHEEVTQSRDTQTFVPLTPSHLQPSGITTKTFKLGETGFKEVSRFRGWVDYAWKAEITNLTSVPIRVTVKIQLLDTDEFELETDGVLRKEIPANSTETVTNKSSMKADIYDRVKKYNVVVTSSPW